jgi:hypothetical protein
VFLEHVPRSRSVLGRRGSRDGMLFKLSAYEYEGSLLIPASQLVLRRWTRVKTLNLDILHGNNSLSNMIPLISMIPYLGSPSRAATPLSLCGCRCRQDSYFALRGIFACLSAYPIRTSS